MERSCGILMPVFSLPSPYGIGTLGREAYRFADFLKAAGRRAWQMLPLGPTSYGDSPYQSFSSAAGNPYFIDLDMLVEDGLLERSEIESVNWGDDAGCVDYEKIYLNRFRVLEAAKRRGFERDRAAVNAFVKEHESWIHEYALFMALKRHFGMKPWQEWPDEAVRLHDPAALARYRELLREDVELFTYIQFLFFLQWTALKSYINSLGIGIIGDLPIYVAMDSADVWAERSMFRLDSRGVPTEVAGVPPDYFSKDGQLWGNPLYDYDAMKRDGFGWWIRRVERAGELFDAIRIDHFRALASYWAVPAGAETAKEGRWQTGPGMALVGVLTSWFPHLRFVAEDLGVLTPDVEELLRASGLPGMKVLEFAFSGPDNGYLPHNCVKNCVLYTGTHDNAPIASWEPSAAEAAYAARYLDAKTPEELRRRMLLAGQTSVAGTFIAQMQDYLGDPGRTNVPGTAAGNWRWRMASGAASDALADEIYQLTLDAGRCPPRNG